MQYFLMNLAVYVLSFTLSLWTLSCVRFGALTSMRRLGQMRPLLLLLFLGLEYLIAQFLLTIFTYNGLQRLYLWIEKDLQPIHDERCWLLC